MSASGFIIGGCAAFPGLVIADMMASSRLITLHAFSMKVKVLASLLKHVMRENSAIPALLSM
jgi:hypothetical protein